jgi:hypothetical protein
MAIKKLKMNKKQLGDKTRLSCRVKPSDPLIKSSVDVASSGSDDSRFTDSELTPGPAERQLKPENSYVLEWTVAFGRSGTATLTVAVLADGTVVPLPPTKVVGEAGQEKRRVVFLP